MPTLPVLTAERLREDASRRLIEETFSPWRVQRWVENDFGVDAVVELTRPRHGTDDHHPTGELFAVQLKATGAREAPTSLRVEARHLRYWRLHSLPVLVVLADMQRNALFGWWVTDDLVKDRLKSPVQASATLKVEDAARITNSSLSAVEAMAVRLRRRPAPLQCAKYLALRSSIEEHVRELQLLADASNQRSLTEIARQVARSMKTAPYSVAITGPQRVGKSVLCNAMMRLSISPVADYPTTAVPIAFLPGESAEARVLYDDGHYDVLEAEAEALRPYAAQQMNVENAKCVRVIEVRLPSEALSRGMSLIDTPGLHDASESVRLTTQVALDAADTIVYVLDASLGSKFKLGLHELNDLKSVRGKERVILLLNQSDGIDDQRRETLLAYTCETLERHGVLGLLATAPIFVSGQNAWRSVASRTPLPADFLEFEELLWGALLRSSSTGLDRLKIALGRLADGCEQCAAMLEHRTSTGREATALNRARSMCVEAIGEINGAVEHWRSVVTAAILQELNSLATRESGSFAAAISRVPVGGQLPSPADVRGQLETHIGRMASWVPRYVDERSSDLAQEVTALVAEALTSFRAELGMPPPMALTAMEAPSLTFDVSLPEVERGFLMGLMGFFVNPVLGAVSTVLLWMAGHEVGVRRRHARHVAQACRHYQEALSKAASEIGEIARARATAVAAMLAKDAIARLQTFIDDASDRIERLGRPLEERERRRLKLSKAKVHELLSAVRADSELLDAYR